MPIISRQYVYLCIRKFIRLLGPIVLSVRLNAHLATMLHFDEEEWQYDHGTFIENLVNQKKLELITKLKSLCNKIITVDDDEATSFVVGPLTKVPLAKKYGMDTIMDIGKLI